MTFTFSDPFVPFDVSDSVTSPVRKNVVITGYEPVCVEDWEPVSIIAPEQQGPWICGGAVLNWFQGRAVGESDIDVFCRDVGQSKELGQRLMDAGARVVHNSTNAQTFMYDSQSSFKPNEWKIQVITREFYPSLEDVIAAFDISVTQIGTDGLQYEYGDHTLSDIAGKILRMEDPPRAGALKRYCKYVAYGYVPVPGLHNAIVTNPNTSWEFEFSDDYDDF